jgi:hypothetical protein
VLGISDKRELQLEGGVDFAPIHGAWVYSIVREEKKERKKSLGRRRVFIGCARCA